METEIDRGEHIDHRRSMTFTLAAGLDRWETEFLPKLAVASQRSEQNRVKALRSQPIASLPLARIDRQIISTYCREREQAVGPHSVRLDLASISRVFTAAIDHWGMPNLTNPAVRPKSHGVRLPKEGRTRRLAEGEEERLIGACGPKFRRVVHFALETAMRRNEISCLTWGKIDLERRTALVDEVEGDVARTVPLSEAAIAILREAPKRKREPSTQRCFGMSPGAISSTMREACAKAGIKNLRFHDLRHEATSRLFEFTDLRDMEIALITGHKTLQMLQRYAHLRASHLAKKLPRCNRNR
jgi:integrase